jgi:hypothetical protein
MQDQKTGLALICDHGVLNREHFDRRKLEVFRQRWDQNCPGRFTNMRIVER